MSRTAIFALASCVALAACVGNSAGTQAIQILWPGAQQELTAYANEKGTNPVVAAAIIKGLPALAQEEAGLSALQNPTSPAQFLTQWEGLICQLPAGTIGTADMAHVQEVTNAISVLAIGQPFAGCPAGSAAPQAYNANGHQVLLARYR